MTCSECGFRFTDLNTWKYPYATKDYYGAANLKSPDYHQPFLDRRLSRIIKYCRIGRSLDVGCGFGEMPLLMHEHGFSAAGLDESSTSISFLQTHYPQIGWFCGEVAALVPTLGQFDVVTLYHVLEHIPHPVELMCILRKIVRPGGYIILEVPNTGGLGARLGGHNWHFYLEHHVNYFYAEHLRMLAKRIGCTTLEVAGAYDFTYPIGAKWKVASKSLLSAVGFQDVLSTVMQCPA
jgi:2-polyprenyl-3-methyl-5-hydroxy-6-metoxy-1,4-benzoquinol methylase